jgi:hypothetical protein
VCLVSCVLLCSWLEQEDLGIKMDMGIVRELAVYESGDNNT